MKINKRTKGFGIIEALIASVIIIVILGSLVFLARSAVVNATYMQQRSEATALAQEGMEVTRQIRDTNMVSANASAGWSHFVGTNATDKISTGTYYYIPISLTNNQFFRLVTNSTNTSVSIAGINYFRQIQFTNIHTSSSQLLKNCTQGVTTVDCSNDLEPNGYLVIVDVYWPYNASSGTLPSNKVEINGVITNARFGF